MQRAGVLGVTGLLLLAPLTRGQVTEAPVSFEVASVKSYVPRVGEFAISKLYPPAVPFRISGSRVTMPRRTLTDLIRDAYDVKEFQVTGETRRVFPTGDRYDIEAKAPGDAAPTVEQVRLMLQSLLADRFQLRLHRDSKQLPVYRLVIGKSGSKLKPVLPGAPPSKEQLLPGSSPSKEQHAIDQLVEALSRDLDRPIINKTGLSGEFEYTIDWVQLGNARRDDPDGFAMGAFSPALEKNLGLKLESAKDQVEILVIDHVERPSDN